MKTLLLAAVLLFQSTFAVTIEWDPNTEANLAGYHVYRAEVGQDPNWTQLTAEPITETTYTDDTPTRSYHYAVTAVDTDGNESDLSDVVRANQPPPSSPDRPGNPILRFLGRIFG